MTKIHILPDNLVNQIAAGEVVERPSSVVKELVENSIDANATRITVEIEEGGKKLIKITDNGDGIIADELPLVFERHATSKIYTKEDLFKISTMGFRGEAMASIGSVSQMTIASRLVDSDEGYEMKNKGGKLSQIQPCGMPVGTQVTVKNLFFNTPARFKFLKTERTEFNHISSYVTDVALMNPQIHFKLVSDGRTIAEYPSAQSMDERVEQVFGTTITKELLPIQFEGGHMSLIGFVGTPGIARGSRQSQYLFVNGRPVTSAVISRAVQNGFKSLLPHGKYPFFILNIVLPYDKVDVNVHPRKMEVRFVNRGEVFQMVQTVVTRTLEKDIISPEISGEARSYWKTEKIYSQPKTEQQSFDIARPAYAGGTHLRSGSGDSGVNQSFVSTAPRQHGGMQSNPMDFSDEVHTHQEQSGGLRPLSQIANSYILALGEEGLFIIDQHAAHERVLYNHFMKRAESNQELGAVESQKLLVPVKIELSHAEVELLNQHIGEISSIGFDIESFGGNAFLISSVPSHLAKCDIEQMILEVIDDLKNGDPKKLKDPQHEAICYMACRGAIKFGQKLDHREMVALLNQMEGQDQCSTCPHGRPTMIRLTFAELEKRFGRK